MAYPRTQLPLNVCITPAHRFVKQARCLLVFQEAQICPVFLCCGSRLLQPRRCSNARLDTRAKCQVPLQYGAVQHDMTCGHAPR